MYVMLITGFKVFDEVDLATMWAFPKNGIHFDNFSEAYVKLSPYFWNSLHMVVPAAIISSILGSLNGYVLAKWKFNGSDIIFPLILFGMFIPYQSIMIPLVETMRTLNLYGGIPGLILAHVIYGIPITTLTFRNYYATIPKELLEAARIDGAGMMRIYFSVLLPISLPSFVVVLIWQFTSAWNDFLFAVILTAPSNWPITVASEQYGRQPDHLLERADGRLIPGSAAHPAGLYLAWQLLYARSDGGGVEGIRLLYLHKNRLDLARVLPGPVSFLFRYSPRCLARSGQSFLPQPLAGWGKKACPKEYVLFHLTKTPALGKLNREVYRDY